MAADSNHARNLTGIAEPAESLQKGRNIIAVIGINDYEHWPKLKNAVEDAIGIQKLFVEKFGFIAPFDAMINNVATKENIISLIDDQLRYALNEDDSLILFFAGHGHTRIDKIGKKEIETGFIIPVEARRMHASKEHWSDYVEIDPLLKSAGKLPARHILVILDSCHSGLALGEAMIVFRDAVRYENDLSSRVSRKIITSARREQLALDSGPIEGHSLFTGTLIDSMNWGKADLDGNDLVTSSELGLFVQSTVGQASESKQTPDFGSFYHDDRGEMVIYLHDETFDAIRARAFSALQIGNFKEFKRLVSQIKSLRPDSPETMYLEFRLLFTEGAIDEGLETIYKLRGKQLEKGVIPLSGEDLRNLSVQLPYWKNVLTAQEGGFPLEIVFLVHKDEHQLELVPRKAMGEIECYMVTDDAGIRLSIFNPTAKNQHIYMIMIDPDGRLDPMPLWNDEDTLWNGLRPGETKLTYPFRKFGALGLFEIKLFSSQQRLISMLAPPSTATRGMLSPFEDFPTIGLKTIYYQVSSKGNTSYVSRAYDKQPYCVIAIKELDLDKDRVLLEAGQAHGLPKNAQFRIYPSEAADLSIAEKAIALAEVAALGATESWANIVEKFSDVAIEKGAQAVLLEPTSVNPVSIMLPNSSD